VRSSLGESSRFTVDAPLATADSRVFQLRSVGRATATSLDGMRVLVIEDDELARQAMCSLLESWGCLVVSADGRDTALRLTLVEGTPDVIVSDYRLRKGENGFEVIAAVRSLVGYAVVACLASGDTDPELIRQAREHGMTLLHKPVRPAKLHSLLHSLIKQAQGQNGDLVNGVAGVDV
jgi:two-component system, sensor histidine kinase